MPYTGVIAVPFGYKGVLNATLMLIYARPVTPTESDLQLIATFADHAGVAMHNADLYEQAQQAAALEERNRLARDLHDSVTQSLFSMSLLAQVLPALWETQPGSGTQPGRTAAALEGGIGGNARPSLPVTPRRTRRGGPGWRAPHAHRVAETP